MSPAIAKVTRSPAGTAPARRGAPARQAYSDEQAIALWLHGRSPNTQDAYRRDVAQFFAHVARPLAAVTLADVQAYADALAGELAPASQARKLAAVKSLMTFCHRIGYIPFNVAAAIRLPTVKHTLAERILSEAAVHRLLALEPDARDRTLLRLCYAAGLRVSELVALKQRDLQPRDAGGGGEGHGEGQVTVYGKGGKTRVILLPRSIWRDLMALRGSGPVDPDAPVFRSRQGGHLTRRQAERIVKRAAGRAGAGAGVSPHWLRHAHASHALDRGAPIHLVKETLGHESIATTGKYAHARPTESSSKYLAV